MALLDWQLADKTVIVTGASSGIGAADGAHLGSAGASVVLVGRDRERLDAVAARRRGRAAARPTSSYAELTDIAQAKASSTQAVEAFGDLHGIVHRASVFDPRPLADTTLESFEVQWRSNVAAPLFMTKAAVPHLKPGSSVVLVASTIALVGFPGCSAYTADEGRGRLARPRARRRARARTASASTPSCPATCARRCCSRTSTRTRATRTGSSRRRRRVASPARRSSPPNIVFMLSGLSEYVHGATLVVDGGWVAR